MMLMMMVMVLCFPRRNVFHFLLLYRFQLRCFPDKQSKLLVAINMITMRMKVEKFRFLAIANLLRFELRIYHFPFKFRLSCRTALL